MVHAYNPNTKKLARRIVSFRLGYSVRLLAKKTSHLGPQCRALPDCFDPVCLFRRYKRTMLTQVGVHI